MKTERKLEIDRYHVEEHTRGGWLIIAPSGFPMRDNTGKKAHAIFEDKDKALKYAASLNLATEEAIKRQQEEATT